MSELTIVWLYHDLMNLYGDRGNVLTLAHRARARGMAVKVKGVSIGETLPQADIIFFGGGQDQEQDIVSADLPSKQVELREHIEKGAPLLAVCGGYQLLGDHYQLADGSKLPGIGLLPVHTQASNKRMINDLLVTSPYGELIGFENHSGQTFLDQGAQPLGKVVLGFGNNGEDGTEGVRYKNAIGTYLHGPLLPKNPKLADALLAAALATRKDQSKLGVLPDDFVPAARKQAVARARGRRVRSLGMHS